MKHFHITIVLLFVLLQATFGQTSKLDIEYGTPLTISQHPANMWSPIVGSNSKGLYSSRYDSGKSFICLFDYKTQSEIARISETGNFSDKATQEFAKKLTYSRAVVLENVVHVIFELQENQSNTLYALTFDADLKKHGSFKKIIEKPWVNRTEKEIKINFFVESNPKFHQNIAVGYEKKNDDESTTVEYKIYDEELELVDAGQSPLPFVFTYRLSGKYTLLSNGDILLKTKVKEEIPNPKGKKRNKKLYAYFYVFNLIKTNTAEVKLFSLKNDLDRVIIEPYITDAGGEVHIDAFYYDVDDLILNDDDIQMNGFFHANLDLQQGGFTNVAFRPFDNDLFNTIYSENFVETKEIDSPEPDKPTNSLKIENIIEKDGYLYFICSRFNDYIITNSAEWILSVHTLKKAIITFKLNSNYSIEWYKIVDRDYRSNSYEINDIHTGIENDQLVYLYKSRDSKLNKKGEKVFEKEAWYFTSLDADTGSESTEKLNIDEAIGEKDDALKKVYPHNVFTTQNKIFAITTWKSDKKWNYVLTHFGIKK